MALQLRRGTDAERSAVTFADGELVYTTDTKKLYVGDGATAGGNSITALTNTLDGDLTGSVFGDDSTVIVDGINNSINSSLYTSPNNHYSFSTTDNETRITLNRKTNTDISSTDNLSYGQILWEREDINGKQITVAIGGTKNQLAMVVDDGTNTFPISNYLCLTDNGHFGVGTNTPTAKLDVVGEGRFTGFVQFGSLTTAQRDALTAVNGMVIYNTTLNKFQGYENTAWVNLV